MEESFNPNASPALLPANKEIRAAAKATLSGRWINPVLCTLVFLIINIVCSAFESVEDLPVLELIGLALTLLILLPLGFGYSVAFLRHVRGEGVDDLVTRPFQAFNQYGRYLGTSLLMTVFVFLWTLLLIVPGIVMGYAYSMTPYIMHDHPELSASECIAKSKQMMKGYKWKLFLLDLGFIGWLLLCVLTLGILTLWIQPWMECSHVKFYEELKARHA